MTEAQIFEGMPEVGECDYSKDEDFLLECHAAQMRAEKNYKKIHTRLAKEVYLHIENVVDGEPDMDAAFGTLMFLMSVFGAIVMDMPEQKKKAAFDIAVNNFQKFRDRVLS